ncbi:MAG: YhdP family protein [Methylococcales bacterium]
MVYAVIISAIVITLMCVALYQVSQNPQFIAQQASKALDSKVTIGRLSAQLHRLQPELELEQVVVLDKTGKQIFSLEHGLARLHLLPLITMGKISAALIAVDQAHFALRKNQQGEIIVDGFDGEGDFFTTLIKKGHYRLTDSEIRWLNDNEKPIVLNQVNVSLESQHNNYRLTTDVGFAEQPGQIHLTGELSADTKPDQCCSGRFFAKATAVQLAELRSVLPTSISAESIPVEQSQGSFSFWGQIKHFQLSSLNGQFSVNEMVWEADNQPSKLLTDLPDQLSADIWMQANQGEWTIAFDQIDLGQWIPSADLQLAIQSTINKNAGKEPSYDIRLSKLELKKIIPLLKKLSPTISSSSELPKLLSKMTVQGGLQDVRVAYQADSDNPLWSVCGAFSQLQIKHRDYVDLQGDWSGNVCANQQRAELTLQTGKAKIYLPTLYKSPLKLTGLNAQLIGQNTDKGWRLSTDNLKLMAADLNLDLNLDLQAYSQAPWVLNTHVDFELFRAKNLKYYLPSKILAVDVDEWLSGLFQDGSLKAGQFSYQGQLVRSPFSSKAAVASGRVLLENTRVQFDPDEEWPELSELNAELHFKNGLATLNVEKASSLGITISKGTVVIKDVEELANVHIKTHLETSLEIAENYVLNSPLEEMIGSIIHYIHPQGESGFDLDFQVPLHSDTDQFWIDGNVDLRNAKLHLSDLDIHVNQVNGELLFTEETVTAEAIRAFVDDQPTQINIKNTTRNTVVQAKTNVSDQFLQQRWPWLIPLEGNANVRVNVWVAKDSSPESSNVVVKVRSDLQGMQVNLPAPLYKTADLDKDLSVKISLSDANLVPVEVHYGSGAHADIKLHQAADEWGLHSAHLMIGKGFMPASDGAELSLIAHLPEWNLLDLQTIKAFIAKLNTQQSASSNQPLNLAGIKLDIDIDQLKWDEASLGSVALSLVRKNSSWHGKIDGSIAAGTIQYMPATGRLADNYSKARGMLSLKLDDVNLANTKALKNAKSLIVSSDSQSISPEQLPGLNIVIKQLMWGDFNLGHIRLDASVVENGLAINKFSMNGRENQLSTKGRWVNNNNVMHTAFDGKLTSKNMAHFLRRFGIYEDIRKTAAVINFNLGWDASPFKPDWQSLNGKVGLKLKHGHLIGLEPGVGRALGLFSLNAWQRRLRFDFSDVIDDGFAYDNVNAKFTIINGNAYSTNLKVDGVAARVNFAGRIGLLDKDIDAVVTVIPRSSIALPLAGAAGGPIGIGAGLVMQQVVGPQFETLSSSEYTITGQWIDPKVTTVPENGGIFTRMFWQLQKLTGTQNKTLQ